MIFDSYVSLSEGKKSTVIIWGWNWGVIVMQFLNWQAISNSIDDSHLNMPGSAGHVYQMVWRYSSTWGCRMRIFGRTQTVDNLHHESPCSRLGSLGNNFRPVGSPKYFWWRVFVCFCTMRNSCVHDRPRSIRELFSEVELVEARKARRIQRDHHLQQPQIERLETLNL